MSQTHVDIAWRYSRGGLQLVDVLMWRCVVMESLHPGGHASVTVLVGDRLFFKKELVYAACFARRPSLQVMITTISEIYLNCLYIL